MMYGTTARQFSMMAHGTEGDGNIATGPEAPFDLEAFLASGQDGEEELGEGLDEEGLPLAATVEDHLQNSAS
jgi:hypothetical protein